VNSSAEVIIKVERKKEKNLGTNGEEARLVGHGRLKRNKPTRTVVRDHSAKRQGTLLEKKDRSGSEKSDPCQGGKTDETNESVLGEREPKGE